LIRDAAAAGVDLIQIREKDLPARALSELVERAVEAVAPYSTRVLVNDRLDVALACGAHGVHLTTQSLPPTVARQMVGDRWLIGASTHSLEEVQRAADGGADFVVCGPVFETPSKNVYGPPLGLGNFERIVNQVSIPVLGLGGIDLTNFRQVIEAGAAGVAAIRLFIEAASIRSLVRAVKERDWSLENSE
jgi:thiamine-phosphate pyrophosphorylase